MITLPSLRHPTVIANIKQAMREATDESRKCNRFGVAVASGIRVYHTRNVPALPSGFLFLSIKDRRNITDIVRKALRESIAIAA